jgi:hypothetical protein
MKSMLTVKNLLVAILMAIVCIYLFRDCTNDPEPPLIEHEIDTVFQEVKVEVPKYVPKWRTKIETVEIHDSIPAEPIDTTAILADYYAKYKTVDTLKLPYPDSVNKVFGYGVVTDVISKNAIESRNIVWNYSIPTVTHTITIHPKPKAQVYIGAMANVNRVQILSSVSGALLYKTKKDRIYIANIGVANNGSGAQPFLGGGVLWKISFKKPKPVDLLLKN